MLQWFFLLFFAPASMGAANVEAPAPAPDYVALVAAEAAYTTLLPNTPRKPERPIDPNCPTCKGTGKVRSGDGLGWSNCPTCQPLNDVTPSNTLPMRELPAPPLFKPAPVQHVPSSR